MAEGAELPVGVATGSSQFPGEIEVPEVSVDVAKSSVQIPGVTEDSGVIVGVATDSARLPEGQEPEPPVGVAVNHIQLPEVVVGPGHTEGSGIFEKEHNPEGVPGATRGCARHRHPLVAARCPRALAASPANRGDALGIAALWWPLGSFS